MTTDQARRRRPAYPGLDPFGFAHQDLFFGRGSEGRVVAAMVASEPISILTGASGTGKSSLLRAMIIPTLLGRGWCVIYLHPSDDPLAALQRELIAQGIPDIDAEIALVDRLLAASEEGSGIHRLDGSTPLSKACDWFQQLPYDDARRMDLIGDTGAKVSHIPLLALALTGVIEPGEALGQLQALAGIQPMPLLDHDVDSTFQEIRALREPATKGRTEIVQTLKDGYPSLVELANKLWRDWLHRVGHRGLVFVLDQAEELYTAFGASRQGLGVRSDRRSSTASSPELRDRFFAALPDFADAARQYPFRFCISLRPEWYTDLRISLGEVVPDETRAMHILRGFQRNQAGGAIKDPAEHLGGSVNPVAIEQIMDALEAEGEGRGIDPFLLGLICRLAWEFAEERVGLAEPVHVEEEDIQKVADGPKSVEIKGRSDPRFDPDGEAPLHPLIHGALRWLFHRFLDGLSLDEQFDAVDIFESLFTVGGTRRIVSESELIGRPLRPREQLKALLERMAVARLIRIVERNAEKFIEVRHDRLAEPLLGYKTRLEVLAQSVSDPRGRYRAFLNRAIDVILRADGKRLTHTVAGALQDDPLPGWARESLRSNRGAIAWDGAAARTLLASLLVSGPMKRSEPLQSGETVKTDLEALSDYRDALHSMLLAVRPEPGWSQPPGRDALTESILRGMQISKGQLAELDHSFVRGFSIDARLLLLDSIVRVRNSSAPLSRDEIIRWTRTCLGLD